MSLIGDVLTQLEVELRLAVPSLPAGEAGVERGWRPMAALPGGSLPHVFLYDESETPEVLIYRQVRVQIQLRGEIVRLGSTHAQALTDYDALEALVADDPTLNGVLEQSTVALDGIGNEQGRQHRAVVFSFSGFKVLG